MYVKVDELEATNDNVVLKMVKWPSSFGESKLILPDSANSYDNGRELYLGEVMDSANKEFSSGDFVAVDIYFGVHVPSEKRTEKIKIVPASGIVLKKDKKLEVMSDITTMHPGIGRVFLKVRKKEAKTASGIIIPDTVIGQDPTAQDVRIADIIESNDTNFKAGDTVIFEEYSGKEIYLDSDNNLFKICYGDDIMAKIN